MEPEDLPEGPPPATGLEDTGPFPPPPLAPGHSSAWTRWRPRAIRFGIPLAIFLVLAMVGWGWLTCLLGGCPNVDRLRAYQPGQASRLLDRKGKAFNELRPVEGETAPLRAIPKHVQDAFLAVEDQRFYKHGGVDWRRVFGAALTNIRSGQVEEGFSTLTMQLARNVFPDRIPAKQRTYRRKLLEVRVAYRIEDLFEKKAILELYLSHIYFGNGARGVDAAARHYFGVPATRLSIPQAALLAALPKGPTLYDPRRHPDRARERRDLVLTLMEKQRRLSPAEAGAARRAPLGVLRRKLPAGGAPGLGPFFAEEVRRQVEEQIGERLYDERLNIATTLDADLQTAAEEELTKQLKTLKADAQGALVALQPGTGDVLAWIGGRDFRDSRFDRVKNSQRQAGSAFKPFVYAAALRQGHILSEHLRDEPFSLDLGQGRQWQPKNYDGEYDGVVTMRDALVRSKNIPTVLLARAVGLGNIEGVARAIGITSDIDQTPALPLGTVAVSPLELATAYQAFASLGEVAKPRFVLSITTESGQVLWKADAPKKERVLDTGIAYLVTSVLQEAVQRGTGTGVRAAGFTAPVAGKTGTTNGATDAWFVGFTPNVVAAVWLGYDVPRPISRAATGGRLAAPVWGRMMVRATRGLPPNEGWVRPEDVVERWVDPGSGKVLENGCRPWDGQAYREVFLKKTLPRPLCPDRGDVMVADMGQLPGSEDDAPFQEMWPGDMGGGSEPPPSGDYEEEERPRSRREERARDRGGEIGRILREARKQAEEEWREMRDEEERRRKDWEKEDRRVRKEWEKQQERERKQRERRARQ